MEGPNASEGTFIIGICHHCQIPRPIVTSLRRCGGCQLVGYCSIDCQKDDRDAHKKICKKFRVVDGKNVLHTTKPWKEHLSGLIERAGWIDKGFYIFQNPRVCNKCHEPRQDRLTDCICNCVSYCSKRCSKADKHHKNECSSLHQMAQSKCEYFRDMSYPFSLYWALRSLGDRPVGQARRPLHDVASLDVHVVMNQPLTDSKFWELGLMGLMPRLKQLNLTFIIQGNWSGSSRQLSTGLDHTSCRTRVVTHSIHEMHYHMFFSSQQYTEPDVIVVYGNSHEMLANEKEGFHSEISYRNMTHNQDTVLVLMDATKDLVIQGFKAVKEAQSVSKLVEIQHNPLYRASTNRTNIDAGSVRFNEKSYFTCLRRK